MKKVLQIAFIFITSLLLVSCNEVTADEEDKKLLLEKVEYINSLEKSSYTVKIDVYGISGSSYYEYEFKVLEEGVYESIFTKDDVILTYLFKDNEVTIKEDMNGVSNIKKEPISEKDYFSNYVSSYGKTYDFNLSDTVYNTEKDRKDVSINPVLTHHFKFYDEEKFIIEILDLKLEILKVSINFQTKENDEIKAPITNFRLSGQVVSSFENILITIDQEVK